MRMFYFNNKTNNVLIVDSFKDVDQIRSRSDNKKGRVYVPYLV